MNEDAVAIVALAAVIAIIGFTIGLFTGGALINKDWKYESVSEGYAQYCPVDGHFAWKGKCDK